MMMENYNLDETSVPIAPAYKDPTLTPSKQQSQSMQLYVTNGGDDPKCKYNL